MSNFEFIAKLWPYIKPYRWQVLFILLGLVIEFSYEASFRYSLKFLIDDVILKKNKEVFFLLFAIFGIVGVVYSVICVTCDYYWARYGAKIFSDLCHDLFQHLQKQPLEYHNRQSSGDLMARFTSDAGIVDTALVIVLPAAFLSTGELLVSSVFLFHLNSLLSFGVLLGICISLYSPRLLIKKTAIANYKLRDYNGRFSSFLQEHISAFKIIQAYNLESHVTTKFREFLNDFVVVASKAYLLSYLSQRLPNLTFLMLNMLIMFCGGLLVMQDQISVGTLVSYQVIFVSMSAAINQMTWIIPNMAAANAAMQRIQEVFDAPLPSVNESGNIELPQLASEIEFRNVCFFYTEDKPVLNNLSFQLDSGCFAVIVGQSGTGKTSLVNLLLRFYEPTAGQVLLNNVDIQKIKPQSLRQSVGVVTQEVSLFNLSVSENIRLGKLDATQDDIEQAAKYAEIHDFILLLPKQYETSCGEAGGLLSGGERQRIALARALLRKPSLLLLDEATSALDPLAEQSILNTIQKLRGQCTIIAITHKLNVAIEADVIFVMDEGHIIEQGNHTHLLNNYGIYSRFWNSSRRAGDKT